MKKQQGIPKDFDFESFSKEAVDRLRQGEELNGKDGILTPLIKQILESALEAELSDHLSDNEKPASNRRNGYNRKQVKSSGGKFELSTPRDREGNFEPSLVKKRQTILGTSLESKIIGLYSLGMSYKDIRDHVEEMYGFDISQGMLSQITDKILPEIQEWQSRPLKPLYAFVWMDAIHYRVREDGAVVNRAVYTIIGIDPEGRKDLLGIYLSENEGAKFWLQVLNDLNMRGVLDILIASIDNLKGFKEAIEAIFPKTEVQLCIVHQIRNSLKYIVFKDSREFLIDLKKVYKASTKRQAEENLEELDKRWGKKYPVVIRSWRNNWDALSQYFKYPPEIRRVVYTTNTIEGFHRQLRKVTKTKGAFASENALLKLIYLASMRIMEGWKAPPSGWRSSLQQLNILFDDRITKHQNDTV
jgi:transposase-like protein